MQVLQLFLQQKIVAAWQTLREKESVQQKTWSMIRGGRSGMQGTTCMGVFVSLPPPHRLLFVLPDLSSEERENVTKYF